MKEFLIGLLAIGALIGVGFVTAGVLLIITAYHPALPLIVVLLSFVWFTRKEIVAFGEEVIVKWRHK